MASKEQFLQKQSNLSAIVQVLRENGSLTRNELTEKLNLSWACVSDLTADLFGQGVITTEKLENGGVKGRIPHKLRLCENKFFVGIDVNAVGLSVCVSDMSGKMIRKRKFPLALTSEEGLIDDVINAIASIVEGIKDDVLGVGVAMQGVFDEKTELWHFTSDGITLMIDATKSLRERVDYPVIVEHDPNCMALGCSDLSGPEGLMMVRVDKGIGVSVVAGGEFFRAGRLELGYNVVNADGDRLCDCVCGGKADDLTAGKYLGVALANACNLISVDKIVLCGERVCCSQKFVEGVKDGYESCVLQMSRAKIEVLDVTDASYGASRLAVVKYPTYKEK